MIDSESTHDSTLSRTQFSHMSATSDSFSEFFNNLKRLRQRLTFSQFLQL